VHRALARQCSAQFKHIADSGDDERERACHYGCKAHNGWEKVFMRFRMALAGALAVSVASAPAQAHHSFAMFDLTKKVTVSGTIRQFQWTNPHSYIQLMAKDASGKDVEYSMEMGAPMYLYARGWRPRTLRAGMQVNITYNPLRNGRPGGVVVEVTTPDGKPIGTNR
jgi:hypothetical protein